MKIVGLQELGALPEGTIYSDYEPAIVEGLYRFHSPIRHEAGGKVNDFFYTNLIAIVDLQQRHEQPETAGLCLADALTRWGLFEDDAQFLVYEAADLHHLVEHLLAPGQLPPKLLYAGTKCQHEDCDGKTPATRVAQGREHLGKPGHPELGYYCAVHSHEVSDEGNPQYQETCPNCDCEFGVN